MGEGEKANFYFSLDTRGSLICNSIMAKEGRVVKVHPWSFQGISHSSSLENEHNLIIYLKRNVIQNYFSYSLWHSLAIQIMLTPFG